VTTQIRSPAPTAHRRAPLPAQRRAVREAAKGLAAEDVTVLAIPA